MDIPDFGQESWWHGIDWSLECWRGRRLLEEKNNVLFPHKWHVTRVALFKAEGREKDCGAFMREWKIYAEKAGGSYWAGTNSTAFCKRAPHSSQAEEEGKWKQHSQSFHLLTYFWRHATYIPRVRPLACLKRVLPISSWLQGSFLTDLRNQLKLFETCFENVDLNILPISWRFLWFFAFLFGEGAYCWRFVYKKSRTLKT